MGLGFGRCADCAQARLEEVAINVKESLENRDEKRCIENGDIEERRARVRIN